MDKQSVIDAIVKTLTQELGQVIGAAQAAYEAATNSESKAEDQYDTRGLEASYLAGAQAERVATLKRMIAMYKYLPVRPWAPDSAIAPGALIELEASGQKLCYFLVQQGGGISVALDGRNIQVITPSAPLGEALLDRRAGDVIELESRGITREYRVKAIL